MLILLFFILLFTAVFLAWRGQRCAALGVFSLTLILATIFAVLHMTSPLEIIL
jgi:hypothetical protein